LLNCPFCGGEAEIRWVDWAPYDDDRHSDATQVICTDCDITTGYYFGTEKESRAWDAWNRRASGWVSVKERLPEGPNCVLCFSPRSQYYISFFVDGAWITHKKPLGDPTHWQPLPEPPEVSVDVINGVDGAISRLASVLKE
jgi:Lar family restriction alleviation protein